MLPAIAIHALVALHELSASSTAYPAPFVERETITVSFGEESFEQFDAVHVSTPWSSQPMILVAPVGFGVQWYEATDDYFDSMLARLAYMGVDVWAVTPRHGTASTLPVGSCAGDPAAPVPAPVDCSAFGEWGIDDVIGDIAFVRSLIDSPLKPTIGGHWTGGMTAVAAVDAEPDAYAGVLLWEGTIFTNEESTLGKSAAVCAALDAVPDAFGADSTPASETLVVSLAQNDPTGLSPFPQVVLDPYFLVAGEATNLEFLHALFIVDNFALLDRVSEGLVFMVGTVEDGPDVAAIGQVFNQLANPDPNTYGSLGILRDLVCATGGDPTYTSNLAAFGGDVFVIGSERGLDDELQDTLDAFTGARYTYADFRENFGVHDLLWSDLRPEVDVEIFLFNYIAQH